MSVQYDELHSMLSGIKSSRSNLWLKQQVDTTVLSVYEAIKLQSI